MDKQDRIKIQNAKEQVTQLLEHTEEIAKLHEHAEVAEAKAADLQQQLAAAKALIPDTDLLNEAAVYIFLQVADMAYSSLDQAIHMMSLAKQLRDLATAIKDWREAGK